MLPPPPETWEGIGGPGVKEIPLNRLIGASPILLTVTLVPLACRFAITVCAVSPVPGVDPAYGTVGGVVSQESASACPAMPTAAAAPTPAIHTIHNAGCFMADGTPTAGK